MMTKRTKELDTHKIDFSAENISATSGCCPCPMIYVA